MISVMPGFISMQLSYRTCVHVLSLVLLKLMVTEQLKLHKSWQVTGN